MTTKKRKALPDSAFIFPNRGGDPDDDAFPINDKARARNALARAPQSLSPADVAKVKAAVKKKFPDIEQAE